MSLMAQDDDQPVTKKEFRGLKVEVDGIDARLIRVEENTTRILDIVVSLDKKFAAFVDLPERMAKAEDDIIKLKSRVY